MGQRGRAVEGMVMAGRRVDAAFWAGRRVLLTGHTGFKGSWLTAWLSELGAELAGFALPPDTQPSIFTTLELDRVCHHTIGDIRNPVAVDKAMADFRPEIVIHMAAQPLVRHSYREPVETFATNVMGTISVLEACRRVGSVRVVIVVTTDKVYANRDLTQGYRETDPLGGNDPYSASKACTELATQSWRASFLAEAGMAVASGRAGNVIGGGDFCEDRIIPDAVRAFARGEPLTVRNPVAIRPWQLVVEPLAGYLLLAERCWADSSFAEGWNFGPDETQVVTVGEVADHFCRAWGGGVSWQSASDLAGPKEAALLLLNPSKARERLDWHPRFSVTEALDHTARWYKALLAGASAAQMRQLTRETIAVYQGSGP
jgi:CDP-glucose 4,6-dehydratase